MKKVVLIVLVTFLLLLFIILVVQIIQFTGKDILDNKNIAEKTTLNKKEKSGKNGEVGGVESGTTGGSEGGGGGSGERAGGGGAGGGGSGGNSGTGKTINEESGAENTQTCTEQQISYSIRNFIKTSTCNEYQENICVDKTLNCSLIVDNLDYEKSGDFEIKFSFLADNNEISSSSLNYFLNPQSSKVFEVIESIKSQREEGNANKEIFCSYNTIKIPQKERC